MKILLCESIVPREAETEINGVSAAGNGFQHNLNGALKGAGHEIKVLSYLGMPVPKSMEFAENADNTIYIKKNRRLLGSILKYKRAVRDNIRDCDCVLCYNIIYAWLFIPRMCRRYKKRSVVIMADYDDGRNCKDPVRKLYGKLIGRTLKRFDRVTALSENIRAYMVKGQEFECFPGGITREFFDAVAQKKEAGTGKTDAGPVRFFFSGSISEYTGIAMLLEAFKELKADARLIITGRGKLEALAEKYAASDERIDFKGFVSHEEYIDILKSADVCVNPRNMDMPENLNNFPSKVLEYMAAGKTVVSTEFPGYEDFPGNMIFVKNDVRSLVAGLEAAAGLTADKQLKIYDENRRSSENFLWDNVVRYIL